MLYDVDPAWRTTTVVDICKAMHHTGDFSALPVLADALEEAGCTDRFLLDDLRGRLPKAGPLSPVRARRLVCEVAGGELAAAVERIEQFAALFEVDSDNGGWDDDVYYTVNRPGFDRLEEYDRLMTAARDRLETGEPTEVGLNQAHPYITWDHHDQTWDQFWRDFALVTGRTVAVGPHDIYVCVC